MPKMKQIAAAIRTTGASLKLRLSLMKGRSRIGFGEKRGNRSERTTVAEWGSL